MTELAPILDALRSKDVKDRIRGFAEAEAYLDSEFVDAEGAPDLVDALVPALSDSNPKFVQGALGLLIALVEVMGEDLAPYTGALWTPVVDKLGDAKSANREKAVDLAVALATLVVPSAQALERMNKAWEHKNWRARESSLLWFGRVLASHESAASLGFDVKVMLPTIVRLLEDREVPVREAAIIAVEQMHRQKGDPLLNDLQRTGLRPNVLKPLMARLTGDSLREEDGSSTEGSPRPQGGRQGGGHFAQDPAAVPAPISSARTQNAAAASSRRPPSPRPGSSKGGMSARGGGMDGGGTSAAEDEVSPVPVYSDKELGIEFTALNEQLRHSEDWAVRDRLPPTIDIPLFLPPLSATSLPLFSLLSPPHPTSLFSPSSLRHIPLRHTSLSATHPSPPQPSPPISIRQVRNSALRRLQGLVLGGACDFDSFPANFKSLREPLTAQVAELRSSLVREACAALCAIASAMREGFEPLCAEYVQPLLKQTVITIQVGRCRRMLCAPRTMSTARRPSLRPPPKLPLHAPQVIREASNQCLRTLLVFVQPVRVTPKILAALADRSAALRKNAIEYLRLLLDSAPAHPEGERCPLEKHAEVRSAWPAPAQPQPPPDQTRHELSPAPPVPGCSLEFDVT